MEEKSDESFPESEAGRLNFQVGWLGIMLEWSQYKDFEVMRKTMEGMFPGEAYVNGYERLERLEFQVVWMKTALIELCSIK